MLYQQSEIDDRLLRELNEMKKLLDNLPRNIRYEKRLLLFPEHNAREYYSVVLKWLFFIIGATYAYWWLVRYLIKASVGWNRDQILMFIKLNRGKAKVAFDKFRNLYYWKVQSRTSAPLLQSVRVGAVRFTQLRNFKQWLTIGSDFFLSFLGQGGRKSESCLLDF